MFIVKKPDDILPILLGVFGILIAFYCPLFSTDNSLYLKGNYLVQLLGVDNFLIKKYADITNRVFCGLSIVYILFLYRKYFENTTLFISIILILNNIFYMALLANALPIPTIDFYILIFFSIVLWQSCFLMPKNIFYLSVSSLIFMGIAFINPVASILLGGALVFSAIIIRSLKLSQTEYFYNIAFIFLCGFCSLVASLIKTNKVADFSGFFLKNYQFPLIICCAVVILMACYYLQQKYLKGHETQHQSSMMIMYYCVTLFVGSVFVGRFDYIAHFA